LALADQAAAAVLGLTTDSLSPKGCAITADAAVGFATSALAGDADEFYPAYSAARKRCANIIRRRAKREGWRI